MPRPPRIPWKKLLGAINIRIDPNKSLFTLRESTSRYEPMHTIQYNDIPNFVKRLKRGEASPEAGSYSVRSNLLNHLINPDKVRSTGRFVQRTGFLEYKNPINRNNRFGRDAREHYALDAIPQIGGSNDAGIRAQHVLEDAGHTDFSYGGASRGAAGNLISMKRDPKEYALLDIVDNTGIEHSMGVRDMRRVLRQIKKTFPHINAVRYDSPRTTPRDIIIRRLKAKGRTK